jgi:hypothetical protein
MRIVGCHRWKPSHVSAEELKDEADTPRGVLAPLNGGRKAWAVLH